MKQVYLVRHAKSSWGEPGLADFDRPLNKRGERDALRMGERLKEMGVRPDTIVSSPAKRALSTARTIADALDYADEIRLNEILYGAAPDDTLGVVRSTDSGHDSVMVFGHNPTMTDLVNLVPGFDVGNVPTCAICAIAIDVDDWSAVDLTRGQLVFYEYPKLQS